MRRIQDSELQTSQMYSLIREGTDIVAPANDILALPRYQYGSPYAIAARQKSREHHNVHRTKTHAFDEELARQHRRRAWAFSPQDMSRATYFNLHQKKYLKEVPASGKNDLHFNIYNRRAPDNFTDRLERAMYRNEPEPVAYPIKRSIVEQNIQYEIRNLLFGNN